MSPKVPLAALAILCGLLFASMHAAAQTPRDATPPTGAALPALDSEARGTVSPEEKILDALEQQRDFEFNDTPLTEVVEFLQDQLEINVVIDDRALTEDGVQTDAPITIRAKRIKSSSLLDLVLRPLGLEWFVEHEVLLITTKPEAIRRSTTKVYEVSDLTVAQRRDGETLDGMEYLAKLIMDSVGGPPDSPWAKIDGEGGVITPLKQEGLSVLVIKQSPPVQRQISALLKELRMQRRGTGNPPRGS
jgi:hypothetical protein